MKLRLVGVGFLLGLFVVSRLGGSPAWAQEREATGPGTGAGGQSGAPEPIAAADVPEAAARAMDELRRIEAALGPRREVAAVAQSLSRRSAEIQAMRGTLDALDPEQLSVRNLRDLQFAWHRLEMDLEGWRSRVDDRWKGLQEIRAQLDRQRLRWDATRRRAGDAGFPGEIVTRVDAVRQELARVSGLVESRSAAVARVIDRLSDESDATSAAQARLQRYATVARTQLMERNAPPIWELWPRAGSEALGVEARAGRQYWLATAQRWLRESAREVALLLVLLLGFVASTLGLRRRSRSWPGDDASRAVALHVVSRPYAAGLGFALAAWVAIVERAPSPITDVVGLLAALVVLRLGPGLVPAALRPAVIAIVTLSVMALFWSLSPDGSLLGRLSLLAGTLLALGVCRLVMGRWREKPRDSWGVFVRGGLQVATLMLVVSAASNLLGWTRLARLLGDGAILSAFAAVAWLVVARAALGLLPLVRSGALVRRMPILERQGARLERLGGLGVTGVAVVLWGWGTLTRLELAGPVGSAWTASMAASLQLGGLEISVGALLAALVLLLALAPISRATRVALQEEVLPHLHLPAGADNSVLTLANYTVIGLGLVLAAGVAGLGSTQLAVVFGALGVGIGFGLQNVVNNFVSGLILIFERPIKVGDRVETTAHSGIVTRIGIRSSTVRSFDGAEVVVPNGELISKEVINWTLSDQMRRVDVRVGVAYGSDARRVVEVLRAVAADDPKVLEEPEPTAVMIGFGDSSLDFRLLAWVQVENFLESTSRIHLGVLDALQRAGFQIPFPQRDLHLPGLDVAAAARGGRPPTGTDEGGRE